MSEEIEFKIEQMSRRIKLNPRDLEALFELGKAYHTKEQLKKAQKYYLKVVKLNPTYKDAYFNLGCAAEESGNSKKATKYFAEAVNVDPYDYEARHRLAGTYVAQKNYAEALEIFRETIERDSSQYIAHASIGYIYLNDLEEPQKSIPYFLEAIRINPKYPNAYYCLACAYSEFEDLQNNMLYLRKFLELPRDQNEITEEQMDQAKDWLKQLEEYAEVM